MLTGSVKNKSYNIKSKLLPFQRLRIRAGSRRGMASAHPTNGVAEDEGKSGGLWPAVEALLFMT